MDFGHNPMFPLTQDQNANTNTNDQSWDSTTPESTVHHPRQPSLYGGDGWHVQADPHLTCLQLHLGKRHYFEDANNAIPLDERHVSGDSSNNNKRGKALNGRCKPAPFAMFPRCQVEGCHVALCNAKTYYRRHRVCDMHSKAPKVVVLGLEQRFCQQCSRFHVVSEFDYSKRSCRRRLAGHNERRRKSSHHSVTSNSTQERCALSLLSNGSESRLSHADLSIRCSEALRELIAEKRAALMTRQVVYYDRDWHLPHHAVEDFKQIQPHSNYLPQYMFPQTQ